MKLRWNPFSLVGSKCSWLYNIPETYTNSWSHILFSLLPPTHCMNMPPTQCIWSCFFLSCYPRILRGISAENTCVLFTLGGSCISCYFCSQCLNFAVALTCQMGLQVNIQQKEIIKNEPVVYCMHVYMYVRKCNSPNLVAQLAGAVEYTDCISAKEWPPPPMSILDITLNNLMVRLQ